MVNSSKHVFRVRLGFVLAAKLSTKEKVQDVQPLAYLTLYDRPCNSLPSWLRPGPREKTSSKSDICPATVKPPNSGWYTRTPVRIFKTCQEMECSY